MILVAGGSVEAFAADAGTLLGTRFAGRFSYPAPHVPAKEANLAVASAQEIHADGVISIGGGSAIGYGKIIALALRLPLIAVPTTYAGAEMTDRYFVTTDRGKETGSSERTLPKVVIRDPALTLGMPAWLTASSGMSAIGNCLEALWHSGRDSHIERCASTALRMLWSTLPRLLQRPDDATHREQALHAAGLAGAVQHARGPGLLTVLAEKLGGLYQVDHGALVACLVPGVLDLHHAQAAAARHALAGLSPDDDPGREMLTDFARGLGLPTRLADLGITDDLTAVASSVAEDSGHAGIVDRQDVCRLLVSA